MPKKIIRGFTLVELLVVISIIGLLAGLMLPAINSAREQGRRASCINNQRNIALAFTMFEQNKGKYPQFRAHTAPRTDNSQTIASFNNQTDEPGDGTYLSEIGWAPQLFPYVEQVQLWDEINKYGYNKNCEVTLELFLCKSAGSTDLSACNYVGNCGTADVQEGVIDQTSAYGLLTDGIGYGNVKGKKISNDDVKDGLSNTLLLSENLQSGTIWCQKEYLVGFCVNYYTGDDNLDYEPFFNEGASPEENPGIPLRPNLYRDEAENLSITNAYTTAGPVGWNTARMSSSHPGVVVAALADGSTRVVSENIDAELLTKAMSPNDKATAFWKKNLFKSRTFDASKLNE